MIVLNAVTRERHDALTVYLTSCWGEEHRNFQNCQCSSRGFSGTVPLTAHRHEADGEAL